MTRRTIIRMAMLSLGALALLGTGCRRETVETKRSFGFDAFVPVYNRYIENYLKTQQLETDKELARVETELAAATEGPAANAEACAISTSSLFILNSCCTNKFRNSSRLFNP